MNNQYPKPPPAITPTHTQPDHGEGHWEPRDEPTQLERIIASQFRRGMPVPLTPTEQQALMKMNLAQRCDYVAKVMVWTARATEKHIRDSDPNK